MKLGIPLEEIEWQKSYKKAENRRPIVCRSFLGSCPVSTVGHTAMLSTDGSHAFMLRDGFKEGIRYGKGRLLSVTGLRRA